jgi:hypothetical protein
LAVPAVLVFSKTVPFRNAPLTTLVVALFVILALPAVLVLRKNRAELALLVMVAMSAELEPWKIRPDAVLLLNPEALLLMVAVPALLLLMKFRTVVFTAPLLLLLIVALPAVLMSVKITV